MANKNCSSCGAEIGWLSTIEVNGLKYCVECSKAATENKESGPVYLPDLQDCKRALSALLTQDDDTRKLFDSGSRTYFKLFGGDINNFINMNSNLVQAAILMQILQKIESIEQKLDTRQ